MLELVVIAEAAVASYGGSLVVSRVAMAASSRYGTEALRNAIEKGQAQESAGMGNISDVRG